MTLQADLDVARNDGVVFTFTVTNVGDEPVELAFRSGFVADVTVRSGDAEIWRWSDGRLFTQALRNERLAPGEALEHTATWSSPVPGNYEAVATLEARDADVEARAAFAV